jgi:hypothetical protein
MFSWVTGGKGLDKKLKCRKGIQSCNQQSNYQIRLIFYFEIKIPQFEIDK